MSPPPKNDWWLAAALSSAAVPGALAQPAQNARPDAVVTTVARPGTAQAAVRHTQVSGSTVQGQRLTTDGQTAIHVLFADQSALTIAPNSEVVVQQYQFEDKAREGRFIVQITKGILRMVGGAITKRSAAVVLTPTATIGIRGGISVVQVEGDTTNAAFLFGDELSVEQGGSRGSVFRPGFGISAGPGGLSQPNRDVFERTVTTLLSQLNTGAPGAGIPGGAPGPAFVPGVIPGIQPLLDTPAWTPPDLPGLLGTPGPGNQS